MNLLITGANGQLGSELRSILQSGKAALGDCPREFAGANILYADLKKLDITDATTVKEFVTQEEIDLIINCAALTNVDACETNPDLAFAVNSDGPLNLALAAQSIGATLVHVSTDYVFAGDTPAARIETDTVSPCSVYGKSKLAGEFAVIANCDKHYIVRTAWLYGREGNNFVKTMIRLARNQGFIKVVNDQIGNPTNANDLAYEILRLVTNSTVADYGIYHCTNQGACSWFEFASAIVDIVGISCEKIPCTTAEFPRPAPRPAYSTLDNAHLRATIGDEMRDWRVALTSFLLNKSS